jgi:hypothetical protein
MSKQENSLDSIRKVIRAVAQAFGRLTDEYVTAYFLAFIAWCCAEGLCSYEGETLSADTSLVWKGRDPKTNALPKGTELRWFKHLFPEIPEERDDYRNNPIYRALQRTIHPRGEQIFKIKKHREATVSKGKGKGKGTPTIVDENNVIQPESTLTSTDFIFQNGMVQSMMDTIASFVIADPKAQARLLDYARSHQVPSSWLVILEMKQAEYIKRAEAIKAAHAEKSENAA